MKLSQQNEDEPEIVVSCTCVSYPRDVEPQHTSESSKNLGAKESNFSKRSMENMINGRNETPRKKDVDDDSDIFCLLNSSHHLSR